MLTADFGTCVSELKKNFGECVSEVEKIANAFAYVVEGPDPLPVTIKTLVSRDELLFGMWWCVEGSDGIEYVYASDDWQAFKRPGYLAGRAILAVDADYCGRYPQVRDLTKVILDNWGNCKNCQCAFQVFEVAEHTDKYLCGTMYHYEYFWEDRSIEITPEELYVFVFGPENA